jgi:hypothetical protein
MRTAADSSGPPITADHRTRSPHAMTASVTGVTVGGTGDVICGIG